ncbi:hypothetical protein QCA50_008585 [Cerrena zonata]|uniref:Oxidase ustYa n=1 Tax=Cerrena zonata TaxID=2478898 RepID=A0AAW0G3Z0_9APHY
MISPVREHYVIPAKVVHTGVLALLLSLLINGIGTVVNTTYKNGLNLVGTVYDGEPMRVPLDIRNVALEVVDSDRYAMDGDNDWASVIPPGHGFVRYGHGDDEAYYAISMYHQMHCLNSFRRMFNGPRNESRAEHDSLHVLHCLTYLRQMVLCASDITLEPAFSRRNVDGRLTQAAYGSGVTHQCRDWVQVRNYAEDNYQIWKGRGSLCGDRA